MFRLKLTFHLAYKLPNYVSDHANQENCLYDSPCIKEYISIDYAEQCDVHRLEEKHYRPHKAFLLSLPSAAVPCYWVCCSSRRAVSALVTVSITRRANLHVSNYNSKT